MRYSIFQDWSANKKNIKARLVLTGFRIAQLATINKFLFFILVPHLVFYRIIVEWILGVELPYKTKIGKGIQIFHGQALVVHDGTVIGQNCVLRHSTTIGIKVLSDGSISRSPIIGDNVDIGSNVCIIGPVSIGDGAKIGAGTVITKDVSPYSVVVGNPFKTIASK